MQQTHDRPSDYHGLLPNRNTHDENENDMNFLRKINGNRHYDDRCHVIMEHRHIPDRQITTGLKKGINLPRLQSYMTGSMSETTPKNLQQITTLMSWRNDSKVTWKTYRTKLKKTSYLVIERCTGPTAKQEQKTIITTRLCNSMTHYMFTVLTSLSCEMVVFSNCIKTWCMCKSNTILKPCAENPFQNVTMARQSQHKINHIWTHTAHEPWNWVRTHAIIHEASQYLESKRWWTRTKIIFCMKYLVHTLLDDNVERHVLCGLVVCDVCINSFDKQGPTPMMLFSSSVHC